MERGREGGERDRGIMVLIHRDLKGLPQYCTHCPTSKVAPVMQFKVYLSVG